MLFVEARPDPLRFLIEQDGVLAIITDTKGPSYRDVGAMMAFGQDGTRTGSLSSGCIEADLAAHAAEALACYKPGKLHYGAGSPWIDLRLPCGGGMEVLLIPRPDRALLAEAITRTDARTPCTLAFDPETGALDFVNDVSTGWSGGRFCRRLLPRLRFRIYGNGVEAHHFATLVSAMGYPATLLSPDPIDTSGFAVERLLSPDRLPVLESDAWTAIVLFFHDHEWEPPILAQALAGPAFYIGAQGSRTARDTRDVELARQGVSADEIARISGPIGLIPSARDPGTLSVSVLAEIMSCAQSLRT